MVNGMLYLNWKSAAVRVKLLSCGERHSREKTKGKYMNEVENSESELITELMELRKENEYLKFTYQKDTSEYKKEIETLRRSEEKYRQYVETAIEGILSLDAERQLTFVNQQMASMLGYSIEEMLGKKYEFFMPEDQLIEDRQQAKIRAQGKNAVYERCFLRKDGQRHWTLVSAKALTDSEGKFAGSFGMFTDINSRKQMENALQESEEKYRLFVETAIEGILSVDSERRLSYVNQQLANMLGYTVEEMLGRKYESFLPEDQLNEDKQQSKIRAQGKSAVYERCFLRKDGQRFWMLVSAKAITDAEGKIAGSFGMFTDINDRKRMEATLQESEEKYRRIVETANEGILQVDRERKLIFVNQQLANMLGYSIDEMLGRKYESFLSEDQLMDDKAQAKIREQGKNSVYERCFLKKDGQRYWMLVSAKAVTDAEGKFAGSFGMFTDINARKQMEASLQESEERYRRIVETAIEGILQVDSDRRLVYVNQQLASMLGYTVDEMLGRKYESFIPEDQLSDDTVQAKIRAQGKNAVYERCFLRKDGQRHWMLVSAKAIIDSDGKFAGSFGMFTDINKRKDMEAALQESEEKYRRIVETANEGVLSFGSDTRLNFVNRQMANMLGYTIEEMLGQKFETFLAEDQLSEHYVQMKNRALGKDAIYERCFKRKDRQRYWMLVSAKALLDESGNYAGSFAMFTDINERKRAEAALYESELQYRLLFETAREGIVVIQKGMLSYFNPMMMEITGHSYEELLNMNFFEFVYQKDRDLILANLNQTITGGNTEKRNQFRMIKKDNSLCWVEMGSVKFTWRGEAATLNFIIDITEQKLAEIELMRLNEELKLSKDMIEENLEQKNMLVDKLEKLNSEKDKFFSIIAHDLRSPFQGFIGLTELMVEEINILSKNELSEMSGELNKSANSLYKLLQNLLEWSQMQKGTINFSPQECSLSEIVNQSYENMEQRAAQKGITLESSISDSIKVYADERMLNTVVRNLLSNAVKFTKANGKVIITAKEINGEIEVCVTDTGVGMTDENVKKLFKLDEKVRTQGTDGEPSTGLGLLLCKEFVEKHGGKIWVESKLDAGSKFYFTVKGLE